ncbi:hypothetical protein HCN44_006005 [Aphidius gifuensis]|uniref:Uncharacterized protein n=1 Tax=Aphidius gifuensis TaxID=684658 RepID=A0A834Y589_APHGI|nr:hypothetical protein HCN44_006005 [Aphidius gifuensis]
MNELKEQKIKIQTKKHSTAAGNKRIADDVIEFLQDKQDGNDNFQKTKNNKVYKRINVVDSDSSSTLSPDKTNNNNIDHGSGVYDNNVMRLLLSDDDSSPQPSLNENTSYDRDVSHNKFPPLKTVNLLPFTIEENITLKKPVKTVKRKLELPDQNTSPINTFRPSSSSSSSCNSSFVNNDSLSSKRLSDRYELLKKKKKYLIDLSSYLSNANEISNKLYEIATEESKEIEEHPYFTLATDLPCELQPLSSEYKHPLDEMTDSDPGTSKQADKSCHKTDRVNEWQFRYSKKGGSIIELMNDSSVLIDKQILENIIRHCKDQRALAKSLYENIFSDEALPPALTSTSASFELASDSDSLPGSSDSDSLPESSDSDELDSLSFLIINRRILCRIAEAMTEFRTISIRML